MAKYIEITKCSDCPYLGKGGGFSDISYKPFCIKSNNKALPFTLGHSNGIVTATVKAEIPDWCPLSDLKDSKPDSKPDTEYLIGQRVIYNNRVICTVGINDTKDNRYDEIWIHNPEVGYKHFVDVENIEPLPNGQL